MVQRWIPKDVEPQSVGEANVVSPISGVTHVSLVDLVTHVDAVEAVAPDSVSADTLQRKYSNPLQLVSVVKAAQVSMAAAMVTVSVKVKRWWSREVLKGKFQDLFVVLLI